MVGGWRLAVGGWRLAVGGWRLAVGNWKLQVASWKLRPRLVSHMLAVTSRGMRNARSSVVRYSTRLVVTVILALFGHDVALFATVTVVVLVVMLAVVWLLFVCAVEHAGVGKV